MASSEQRPELRAPRGPAQAEVVPPRVLVPTVQQLGMMQEEFGFEGPAVVLVLPPTPESAVIREIRGMRQRIEGLAADVKRGQAKLLTQVQGNRPAKLSEEELGNVLELMLVLQDREPDEKVRLYDVFVHTVLKGGSQRAAAKKWDCSLGHASKRVKEMEREFGHPVKVLRAYARRLVEMSATVKGRRRRPHKPGSRPGDFADDPPGGEVGSEDGEEENDGS